MTDRAQNAVGNRAQTGRKAHPDYPVVNKHIRVEFDQVRREYTALSPENVAVLNPTGAAILYRCDGRHSVGQIIDALREHYAHVNEDDVIAYINRLATLGYIGGWDGHGSGHQ